MAKQRVVNTYFWSDDFILDLKPDEKLLFLYVLTNPQTDLCGAYQIAIRKIVFETRLTEKRIMAILEKFEAAGKVCYRHGWMLVRNFTRHQSSSSPRVQKGIERSLSHCPDWVKELMAIGFDRVSKGVAPELLPEPEPSDVFVPREPEPETRQAQEPSFAQLIVDGIRDYLHVLQLPNEPLWLIETERAEMNGFSVEHCLETFQLMSQQKWRTGPIKPATWAENLPILDKLRDEKEQKHEINQRHSSNGKPTSLERIGTTQRNVIDQYPTEAELRGQP